VAYWQLPYETDVTPAPGPATDWQAETHCACWLHWPPWHRLPSEGCGYVSAPVLQTHVATTLQSPSWLHGEPSFTHGGSWVSAELPESLGGAASALPWRRQASPLVQSLAFSRQVTASPLICGQSALHCDAEACAQTEPRWPHALSHDGGAPGPVGAEELDEQATTSRTLTAAIKNALDRRIR
jgi:hypothetical protein